MVCKPPWKILPEELSLQNPLLPSLQTSLNPSQTFLSDPTPDCPSDPL